MIIYQVWVKPISDHLTTKSSLELQFWKVSLTWVEPGKWCSSCGLSFEFNFQWKVYGSIQTTKVNSVPYFTNKMKHSKHLPKRKEFWDKFDFKVNVLFRRTQWKYLMAMTLTDFFPSFFFRLTISSHCSQINFSISFSNSFLFNKSLWWYCSIFFWW